MQSSVVRVTENGVCNFSNETCIPAILLSMVHTPEVAPYLCRRERVVRAWRQRVTSHTTAIRKLAPTLRHVGTILCIRRASPQSCGFDSRNRTCAVSAFRVLIAHLPLNGIVRFRIVLAYVDIYQGCHRLRKLGKPGKIRKIEIGHQEKSGKI